MNHFRGSLRGIFITVLLICQHIVIRGETVHVRQKTLQLPVLYRKSIIAVRINDNIKIIDNGIAVFLDHLNQIINHPV